MGIENKARVTVPSETVLAEVIAYPDEVQIEVNAKDGIFTVEQAREFAGAIIQAAGQAGTLDWSDDAEPKLVARS